MTTTVDANNSSGFKVTADTSGILQLQTNGTAAVTIDTSQNVGIGSTSPTDRLDIRFASGTGNLKAGVIAGNNIKIYNTVGDLALSSSDAVSDVYLDSQRNVYFKTANTQRMTLDASGNLGLGVTPSVWVTTAGRKAIEIGALGNALFGAGAADISMFSNAYINTSSQITYANNGLAARYQIPDGQHRWYIAPSGTAGNTISFTQAMTLDTSGNLLVGTTTAGGGTARVYINGDATNPAFRALANTTTTSVYAGVFRHESTTAGAYIQFVTDSNVETGRIYDLAGTMQYASSSDARLKTNVQPMQNGLQSVLALNPCTFDMRRGEDTFIPSSGLIAQEVHEVYPFIVGVGGDDENTNPWSVDYGKLTPLLVAAIKDQQALITQLQADVAALKGASA